jgi:hypothetical protein
MTRVERMKMDFYSALQNKSDKAYCLIKITAQYFKPLFTLCCMLLNSKI